MVARFSRKALFSLFMAKKKIGKTGISIAIAKTSASFVPLASSPAFGSHAFRKVSRTKITTKAVIQLKIATILTAKPTLDLTFPTCTLYCTFST